MIVSTITHSALSQNLLTNGSFENGFTDWNVTNPVTNPTSGAQCGSYAAFISSDGGLGRHMYNINELCTYSLTFKARKEGGNGWTWLSINAHDSSWNLLENVGVAMSSTNWTDYTIEIVAPASTEILNIWVGSGNGADLRLDCFELNEVCGPTCDTPNNISTTVATGTDDAEEQTDGTVITTSSDLELVTDSGNQIIGIRFTNLNIPQGNTISSARIEFTADETNWDITNLDFYGQDIDDAPGFTASNSNISNRTKTSASVTWHNVMAWETIGNKYKSPELYPIVQEIVNRTGWASGNDMAFIIEGTGKRVAVAQNGNATNGPKLIIEHCTPAFVCQNGILANESFESGAYPWNFDSNSSLTSDAYSGANAVRILGGVGGFNQGVVVSPGSIHSLSVYAKKNASELANIGINYFDSNWNLISGVYEHITSTDYEVYYLTGTAPPNTAFAVPHGYKNNGPGEAFFDDFCFELWNLTPPSCTNNSCVLAPSFNNYIFSIDDVGDHTYWMDYDNSDIILCDNQDGTYTIEGNMINGRDADWGSSYNAPCGAQDGWYLELNLYDKQTWDEFQGNYVLHTDCPNSYLDLDYWNCDGTLTGTGCNAGRTIDIHGPSAGYRLQIGQGGNSHNCGWGISSWFWASENGSSVNLDIYANIDSTCYVDLIPEEICANGIDDDFDGFIDEDDAECMDCCVNMIENAGFENYPSNFYFTYTLQGIPTEPVDAGSYLSTNWIAASSAGNRMWLINDSNDQVNNPEGDLFAYIDGQYDCAQLCGVAANNCNISTLMCEAWENGATYELCFDAAAWNETITNYVPAGAGTQNGTQAIVDISQSSSTYQLGLTTLPASTTFTNLNWVNICVTFTFDASNPIETIYLSQEGNGGGMVVDNLIMTNISNCAENICDDNTDNDGDGDIDCADSDCHTPAIISSVKLDPYNPPSYDNGRITITADGQNLEYSIDGGSTYQTSNIFNNLPIGNYNVRVRNSSTNCYVDYPLNPVALQQPPPPSSCGNRITTDLIALYDFDEGSGNTVYDVSGVGVPVNLTIDNNSNINWTSEGLDIQSATIINSGTAASKISNEIMSTDALTLEVWVDPANTTQTGPSRIMTLSNDTGNRNFTLGQSATDYSYRLRTSTTNNNGTPETIAGAVSGLQHVVYTWDGASSTEKVYIDGIEIYSGSKTGSTSNWNNAYQFAFGNEITEDRPWLGEIKLAAVYKRALNISEISTNYLEGSECAPENPNACGNRVTDGLRVMYDFNEGSGNIVNDVSGVGSPLNLTIANTSNTSWVSGGLRFDSGTMANSGSAATKVNNAIIASNEMTFEVWAKPTNNTQGGPARIMSISENTAERNATLGQESISYAGRTRTSTGNNNGTPEVTATPLNTYTLQHVIYTWNGNNGNEKIYINGTEQYSGTRTGNASNWNSAYQLIIGNELTGDRTWLGEIALAAVYDKALSASEVSTNYNEGPECQGLESLEENCDEGITIDHYGASCDSGSATINVPNTSQVNETVIEIVYKGCDPGSTVTVSSSVGNITLNEVNVSGGSSSVYVYSTTVSGGVSNITHSAVCGNCNNSNGFQSLVVYAERSLDTGQGHNTIFTSTSGHCSIHSFALPIPQSSEPRDINLILPFSELTDDGRYLTVNASSNTGSVSGSQTIYGPDLSLGPCCLAFVEITLNDVPANSTQILVDIITNGANNPAGTGSCGQSWVMAGTVYTEIICTPEICDDNLDNDGDGDVDCADSDCYTPAISGVVKLDPRNPPSYDNGSITINATGQNLEYSIDGGTTYQSSNIFNNLPEGTYSIRVRNSVTGCYEDYAITTLIPPPPECFPGEIFDPTIDCPSSDPDVIGSTSPAFAYCNEIGNYEFDNGTAEWEFYAWGGSVASLNVDNTGQLSGTNSALVDITTASGTTYNIELIHGGHTIDPNENYFLQFEAKAAATRDIRVLVQLRESPWSSYFYETITLSNSPQTFTFEDIQLNTSSSNIAVNFQLGEASENVWIDNVFLGSQNCPALNITYTWEKRENNGSGWSSWSTISGANSETYDPTTVLVPTQFRRVSVIDICGTTEYTNVIEVEPCPEVCNVTIDNGCAALNSNPGFENSGSATFSDSYNGVAAELLPRSSTAIPGWFADYSCVDPCPESYWINDTNNDVNNPEGDKFVLLTQQSYCMRVSMNLIAGECYDLSAFGALYSTTGSASGDLKIEYLNTTTSELVEIGSQTFNSTDNFNYLDWDQFSTTFEPNETRSYSIYFSFTNTSGFSDGGFALDDLRIAPCCTVICPGENLSFTASATGTVGTVDYLWSNGSTSNSITVSPNTTTTYTVTITDDNGCTDTDDILVTVEDPASCCTLDATIDNGCTALNTNAGFENSGSATFSDSYNGIPAELLPRSSTAIPGWFADYSCVDPCPESYWINDTNDVVNNPEGDKFVLLTQQSYCMRVSMNLTAGECYDLSAFGALYNTNGAATGDLEIEYLNTQTSELVEIGSISFNATDDFNNLDWQQFNTTFVPNETRSYTIYFSFTNTSGFSNGGFALDDVRIAPCCTNVCEGETLSFTVEDNGGQGTVSYNWSNGSSSNSITVNPSTTTTYTVTVTDSDGCEDIDSITVYINPIPTVTLDINTIICADAATITLTGGSPAGGTYTGVGVSGNNFDPSIAGVGIHMITYDYTDNQGCQDSAIDYIVVKALPEVEIPELTFCEGETNELIAEVCEYYPDISAQRPLPIWGWGTQFDFNGSKLTGDGSLCFTLDEVINQSPQMIGLNNNPNTSSSFGDIEYAIYLYIRPDANRYLLQIRENGASKGNVYDSSVSYVGSEFCIRRTGTLIEYLKDGTVVYTSTVASNTDLYYDHSFHTGGGVWTAGYSKITDISLCAQSDNIEMSYAWSTGSTDSSIDITSPGDYTLSVTDAEGCVNEVTQTMIQNDTLEIYCERYRVRENDIWGPWVSFNGNCTIEMCELDGLSDIQFDGGPNSDTGWVWTDEDGNVDSEVDELVVFSNIDLDDAGTYSGVYTSPEGCVSTLYFEVVVYENIIAEAGDDQTICEGETATLVASGGDTYLWDDDNNSTTASINVSPLATREYKVTVTSTDGCSDIDSVEVEVLFLPIVTNTSATDATCALTNGTITFEFSDIAGIDSLQFSIDGGTTWSGSVADNSANYIYTDLSSGTYNLWVRREDSMCPINLGDVTIIDKDIPTVDLGPNQEVCPGETATFSPIITGGQSPLTYEWIGPDGYTASTGPITVSAEGGYVFTVTDNDGCTATSMVILQVMDVEGGGIESPDMACPENDPGEITELDAPSYCNYIYNHQADQGLSGWYFYNHASLTTPGTMTLDNNGEISGKNSVFFDITETGASPWYQQIIFFNNATEAGETYDISFDAKATGTKTLRVYVQQGESPWTVYHTEDIVINTTANTYTITASPTLSNHNTRLTFVPGLDTEDFWLDNIEFKNANCTEPTFDYKWECRESDGAGGWTAWTEIPGATSATYDPPIQNNHKQYRRLASVGSCDDYSPSNEIQIDVCPCEVTSQDETICLGESVTLTTSSEGIAPFTYSWTPTTGLDDPTSAAPVATPASTTTYTVVVTDNIGCTSSAETIVTVHELPQSNLGSTQNICEGETATLSANVSGGLAPYTYVWSTGETTESISVSPSALPLEDETYTYTVDITDANGCTSSESVDIRVYALPAVTVSHLHPTCDANNGAITFSFGDHLTRTNIEFSLDNGVNYTTNVADDIGFTTIENLAPGSYDLWVRWGNDQCPVFLETLVLQDFSGNVEVDLGDDQTICEGSTITLNATTTGGTPTYQYIWDNGLGTASSVDVSPTATTTYTVTVTDFNGCSNTDEITINVPATPTISLGNSNICTGESTTLSPTINGGQGTPTYQWQISVNNTTWEDIAGATNMDYTTDNLIATTYYRLIVNWTDIPCVDVASNSAMVEVETGAIIANIMSDVDTICQGAEAVLTVNENIINGGLIDHSSWTNGTGSVGQFNRSGSTDENHRITGTDPWGKTTTVWEARPDATSNADGGWNSDRVDIDHTQLYRVSVWVNRKVLGTNGRFYLGSRGYGSTNGLVRVTNGTTYTNPYFWVSSATPSQSFNEDEWVLVVGHIFPSDYNGNSSHTESGRYTTKDGRVGNIHYDFKWLPETTESLHRTYCYYSTDPTVRQQWIYPRFDLVDGTEPSIDDLLNGFDNNDGLPSGADWEWRTGSCNGPVIGTGSTITVNPSVTTTYYVTSQGACNDPVCDQITVPVYNESEFNAGGDQIICMGDVVILNASGGVSYVWSPSTGLSDPNISKPYASPTETTTYSVTITDENGCTGADEMTVTVYDCADPSPCFFQHEFSNTNYYGSDGTESWSDFGWDEVGDNNTAISGDIMVSGGRLIMEHTDATLPSIQRQVNLSGHSSALLSFNFWETGNLENDDVFQVDVFDGTDWHIVLTFTGSITGTQSPQIDISDYINTNTEIRISIVSGFDDDEELNIDDVRIDVDCLCDGIADAGIDLEMCEGDSIQLQGTGGVEYLWSPDESVTNPTVSDPLAFPSLTTTFTLTVTDENGCTDTDEVIVTVHESVAASLNNIQQDHCQGGNGEVVISVTEGMAPFTITWQNSEGQEQGSTTLNNTGNYTLTGLNGNTTYCIQVTDSNGCNVDSP